ncbi:MAG: ABC transporter substrate-binding protein, partial [Dehalococcoidia bacterium]|nr:ABC transporter substrate-binding protein [Dehalococcoidia bacterium]
VTADDVAFNLTLFNNDLNTMNYRFFSFLIAGIEATKTGPWEVSITHPMSEHLGNIMRIVDNNLIFPPELYEIYGTEMSTWQNSVGTGPYMIVDSVPDNMTTLVRNPDYYFKDPVGLGQGNQLPYIETVKVVIIPDLSTQQAALRTANIDQMGGYNLDDKNVMLQQCPNLKWEARGGANIQPAYMRIDQPPFDNVKVRRAMMMAVNLDEINQGLYAGLGTYPSWPYYYSAAYKDLYLSLDDPACPDTVKELFTYNPDKAKDLLAEAGYGATGIKTEVTLLAGDVDYYTIIQEYLKKINVEMSIRVIADMGALMGVAQSRDYEMIVPGVSPPATYPEQYQYTGGSYINGAVLDDPYVNEMADKARVAALTDMKSAMKITKELQPYIQDLALCLQTPRYPLYTLWWPWLKNYSGESNVGYWGWGLWIPYCWIDQDLKKSMGY